MVPDIRDNWISGIFIENRYMIRSLVNMNNVV